MMRRKKRREERRDGRGKGRRGLGTPETGGSARGESSP
jgi:hypothetical protein